jgi:tetratricopeptide (TPR) repeat protein
MVIPLPPLEAFRADRKQATRPIADDATWLQVAILAYRAASLPAPERAPHLATIRTLGATDGDVYDLLIARAVEMEFASSLRLALSVYDATIRLLPSDDVERRGRLLAYQGRALRQMGELDCAAARYQSVTELGAEYGEPSLLARAQVGFGVIAFERGNIPAARAHYQTALSIDGVANDTRQAAHHGLMTCAASANDLGLAAQHAWHAYVEASGFDQIAALGDLSEILLRAGHSKTALSGFAAAATKALPPRLELPFLGGLAVAAARALPDESAEKIVRKTHERVEILVASTQLPHQHAVALIDLGDAFDELGDSEEADRQRKRAKAIASANRYYELVFKAESSANAVTHAAAGRPISTVSTPSHILEGVESLYSNQALIEGRLELAGV